MIGVKNITFVKNDKILNINIGNKSKILYKDISHDLIFH